jgi:hypothetical protein
MSLNAQRVPVRSILLRNHPLLTRMIWEEYRVSISRVCGSSGGIHPWLDCAVTICWRVCLPVANHTCLSESRCRPFRPVQVRLDRLFDRFLREQRQVDDHIFESPQGGVQIKIIDVNDKEFGI